MSVRIPIVLCILLWCSSAQAKTLKLELVDGMEHDLPLNSLYTTTLHYPIGVVSATTGNEQAYKVEVEGSEVRIKPLVPVPPETNLNVVTMAAVTVGHIVPASRKDAVKMVRYRLPKRETTPPQPPLLPLPTDDAVNDIILTRMLDAYSISAPTSAVFVDGEYELTLELGRRTREGEYIKFLFKIINDGTLPYPVQELRIFDKHMLNDHLVKVRIREGTLPATIPLDGGAIEGAVLVRPDVGKDLRFQLVPKDGVTPVVFAVAAELNMWPEKREPPNQSLHKVSVGMHGFIGAIQLDDGSGITDWTRLQGVGVRATYGALKYLSIEGGLDYLGSGQAELSTGTTLTGGRFQANALLHVGDTFVPYLRGGVGVVAGSQSPEGGDSQFRLEGVTSLGIGFDAWIGTHIVAGVSATAAFGGLSSIEFGGRLAYAWKP